ncbi:hypothetical protein [Lapillicoccus sp.]|uniref:hypothetical protein n=1 Tax=Lapillicoccus sp. TaxID=1909287 RepID=UPI00398387A0
MSEIFPLEVRRQAISSFFAVAQGTGALGPVISWWRTSRRCSGPTTGWSADSSTAVGARSSPRRPRATCSSSTPRDSRTSRGGPLFAHRLIHRAPCPVVVMPSSVSGMGPSALAKAGRTIGKEVIRADGSAGRPGVRGPSARPDEHGNSSA